MDFKRRPQTRVAPQRVYIQDRTAQSFRAYRLHDRAVGRTAPQLISDVSKPVKPIVKPPVVSATPVPHNQVTAKAQPKLVSDFVSATPKARIPVIPAQPYAKPAQAKLQHSKVLARRGTPAPARTDKGSVTQTASRTLNKSQLTLMAMAVIVFAVGMLVSIDTFLTNHDAKTQVAALSQKVAASTTKDDNAPKPGATSDVVVPSEVKPRASSVASYQSAPDTPKLITISKLGVKARVKTVGTTPSGELGTPASIYDTAWYNGSAKPGAGAGSGAVLIDGHVHGPTLPGVFVDIKKLVAGDTIQVTRGDDKVFTYLVMKTQAYPADALNVGMLLTSIQPGKPGLNLITCGGKFDSKTQHYEDRTVVFAVQQS